MTQPDFGQFFHTDVWTPVRYELREGANLRHDVVYLSSYLHDARFRPKEMLFDGVHKQLRIPLERDTWETYRSKDALDTVPSELRIGRLNVWKWRTARVADLSSEELPETVMIRALDCWYRLHEDDDLLPVLRIWTHEGPHLILELAELVDCVLEDDDKG